MANHRDFTGLFADPMGRIRKGSQPARIPLPRRIHQHRLHALRQAIHRRGKLAAKSTVQVTAS